MTRPRLPSRLLLAVTSLALVVVACGTTGSGSTPAPGETPVVGVPYYVDVDVECRAFRLGDQVFMLDEGDTAGWSTPHEGGMFTLDTPDHGTFTGDSAGTKTATFRVPGPAEDIFCSPRPRR